MDCMVWIYLLLAGVLFVPRMPCALVLLLLLFLGLLSWRGIRFESYFLPFRRRFVLRPDGGHQVNNGIGHGRFE